MFRGQKNDILLRAMMPAIHCSCKGETCAIRRLMRRTLMVYTIALFHKSIGIRDVLILGENAEALECR